MDTMNLNLQDRVGLSGTTYRGPINVINPVWESFLGPVGGTVVKTITNEHKPEKHRYEVEWDHNKVRSKYSRNELFRLSPLENARSKDWQGQVEDDRDLVFLAFLPDQMFRIGISFSLSPEDRRRRDEQSPYLLLFYQSALCQHSTDHRLMERLIEFPSMLQAFPNNSHYGSLARFTHLCKLPTPRSLPRTILRLPDVTTAMKAVPDGQYRSSLAIFTIPAFQNTEAANIYDVLFAYLDTNDFEEKAVALHTAVEAHRLEQAVASI